MRSACRRLSSDGPPVVAHELPLGGAASPGRESRRDGGRAAVESAITVEGGGPEAQGVTAPDLQTTVPRTLEVSFHLTSPNCSAGLIIVGIDVGVSPFEAQHHSQRALIKSAGSVNGGREA